MVQVDVQQRHLGRAAAGTGIVEPGLEGRAVAQAGQCVAFTELLQALAFVAMGGRVMGQRDDAHKGAVVQEHRAVAGRDLRDRPVRVRLLVRHALALHHPFEPWPAALVFLRAHHLGNAAADDVPARPLAPLLEHLVHQPVAQVGIEDGEAGRDLVDDGIQDRGLRGGLVLEGQPQPHQDADLQHRERQHHQHQQRGRAGQVLRARHARERAAVDDGALRREVSAGRRDARAQRLHRAALLRHPGQRQLPLAGSQLLDRSRQARKVRVDQLRDGRAVDRCHARVAWRLDLLQHLRQAGRRLLVVLEMVRIAGQQQRAVRRLRILQQAQRGLQLPGDDADLASQESFLTRALHSVRQQTGADEHRHQRRHQCAGDRTDEAAAAQSPETP